MENNVEPINKDSQTKPRNYWIKSDQERLIKVLSVIINGQKAYGKEYSISDTYAYFKMKLEHRYSVDHIIFALNEYTDRKNDIPSPADIINILDPEPPRISEAQYIAAQKWQERNGYPIFSDAKDTIQLYEKQEADAQKSATIKRGLLDCMEAASKGALVQFNPNGQERE